VAAQQLQVQVPVRTGATGRTKLWVPWAFLAPNLLGMLAFTLVPVITGLLISFTDWNVVSGIEGIRWVGLANFTELFADTRFWQAAGRTVLYAGVAVPATTLLGLALAIALNRPLPGRGALRAIFFIPHIVNMIAIGTAWLLLLNPTSGLVNQSLQAVGLREPPLWLISTTWALPALMMITLWGGVGYVAVIYLAALQSMPRDLYEAAMVDGAGVWRRFRSVTWPGLMPTTTFLAITAFIAYSQGFGLIAYLTAGGPGDSTTTLSYYMYQNGFQYYRFGYAAAMGVVSFLGVMVLTLLMWRYQKGRGLYS
jgi:multiple sugar transport system permease protein